MTSPPDTSDEISLDADSIMVLPAQNTPLNLDEATSLPPLGDTIVCTPKPLRSVNNSLLATSPLSSPPADIEPPSVFRRSHNRMLDITVHSSSPLSSPPPNLFDPFDHGSEASPSRRSSTSHSDLDDTFNSNPISSQTSLGGRSSLPNMKGKDLFDASIWADPLRTSVFYTFATSLRQKARECVPTSSHHFISHLRNRGKLVRCYTQNIDRIEEKVGLSTSLEDGPGSRGRFSRRSTANMSQLSKMVDEANQDPDSSQDMDASQMSSSQLEGSSTPGTEDEGRGVSTKTMKPPKLQPSRSSGTECVLLHGSLECLRCFLCGRISSWDDSLENATLSGQQPECPHCIGATAAREERGKRALGVGKLRPDIVLYGEEHPNSHLISPIITHDLSLCPDLLLILGTSLRVHSLKVMVREFAKAIHDRGGVVVFVNFTKPPESSWGDVIDYWVQWDCDTWVSDLQERVPKLWEEPPPPKRRKTDEEKEKEKRERPAAANPVALRNTNATGVYWTLKIRDELHRITGNPSLEWRAAKQATESVTGEKHTSTSASNASLEPALCVEETIAVQTKVEMQAEGDEIASALAKVAAVVEKPSFARKAKEQAKSSRKRKSASGALERPKKQQPSTLNPDHGRAKKPLEKSDPTAVSAQPVQLPSPPKDIRSSLPILSSILNSVKEHPRIRKRKKIDGEEVPLPGSKASKASRFASPQASTLKGEVRVTLAPITNTQPPTPSQLDPRPKPMEPTSPPLGPPVGTTKGLFYLSEGLKSVVQSGKRGAERVQMLFSQHHPWPSISARGPAVQQNSYNLQEQQQQQQVPQQQPRKREQPKPQYDPNERDIALVLAEMKTPADYVR